MKDSDFEMEDNITTPPPFNSPGLPKSWYLLFAVMQLFLSLFCLFMVMYLSIRLKKRAWDSPAKRFGNILNVLVSLTFLAVYVVVFNFYPPLFFQIFRIIFPLISFIISISLYHLSFLYLTAICMSLLLQIVSPFLNERLKQCTRKTHCALFTEVVCHMLLPVLSIVLTTLSFYIEIYLIGIGIISIVFVLFFSSCLIYAFVFLMKFFRNQNIALSIIIKLVFLLIIYILFSIGTIIIAMFSGINSFNYKLTIYVNVEMVLNFILSILVLSLNHPIWCCKCRCRRSPGRAPLLPANDTEEQQTNPVSVWDHRNVPSYTTANRPYEMSDCRSDYEQLP